MKTMDDIYLMAKFMESLVQCTSLHCHSCYNQVNCKIHNIAINMILRGEY